MNQSKLLRWSITVALAGFLFGFDTVVISGADQTLQELWKSPDWFHGLVVMSSALWGTVIGALFGSIPEDKLPYGYHPWDKENTLFIGWTYFIYNLEGETLTMTNTASVDGPRYVFKRLRK